MTNFRIYPFFTLSHLINKRFSITYFTFFISTDSPAITVGGKYLTSQKRVVLSRVFSVNSYPSRNEMERLSKELDLSFVQVRSWFCNKRFREKKLSQLDHIASGLVTQKSAPEQPRLEPHHGYASRPAPYHYSRPSVLSASFRPRYRPRPSNQPYPFNRVVYPSNHQACPRVCSVYPSRQVSSIENPAVMNYIANTRVVPKLPLPAVPVGLPRGFLNCLAC